MKKLMTSLCAAIAVAFVLAGCSKGPDSVAVKFLDSFADGDFEAAAEYASKDAKPLFAMMASMPKEEKEGNELKGCSFEVVETKIDGDTAKVKIKATKDGKSETEDLDLVKEDGEWKVAVKKD